MKKKMLKLLFGILILSIVIFFLDLETIFLNIRYFPIEILITVFLLQFIKMLFYSLKYFLIINNFSSVKIKRIMTLYWASDFTNLLGLGGIPGEVYKAMSFKNKREGLFMSLMDRILSIFWFSSIFLIIFSFHIGIINYLFLLVIISVILLFFLVYLLQEIIISFFSRLLRVNKKLISLFFSFNVLSKHFFLCLLILFLGVFEFWLILLGLGVKISFVNIIFLVVSFIVISAIPFSYKGIGIREAFLLYYANYNNINLESLVTLSLLMYFVGILYQFSGFIPFSSLRKEKIKNT